MFRIPGLQLGEIELRGVGFLGTAPVLGTLAEGLFGDLFWDNWRKAAPIPVVGWLGANALRDFELTIDFPNRVSYWRRERAPDPTELDQPPITLLRQGERFLIGGVTTTLDGRDVTGVERGDELLAVDDVVARGASKDAVLTALHGAPGEKKRLTLERGGARLAVDVEIRSFR